MKPPEKSDFVQVSSTDCIFISSHKQLLLNDQVMQGNDRLVTNNLS